MPKSPIPPDVTADEAAAYLAMEPGREKSAVGEQIHAKRKAHRIALEEAGLRRGLIATKDGA